MGVTFHNRTSGPFGRNGSPMPNERAQLAERPLGRGHREAVNGDSKQTIYAFAFRRARRDPGIIAERDRLGSSSCENQRQEELLQAKAFFEPELLELNAHAIRPDDSDHART